MDDRFTLIDAFVDGERVDAAALKRALGDEAVRDYFVDAWLLREGVQEDLAAEPVPSVRVKSDRRWPMLAIAASLACLLIGGLAGYRLAGSAAPARPDASAPGAPAMATPAGSFPAPPATRAIPVEFSTDSSAPGGN
jgi:hypothetical protein